MTMIYDPAHPIVRADPYPAYARLREEEPVHWHPGLRCWILTRYEDVAAALSGPSMSPDRLTPFYAALPEQTQSLLAEMMRYLNLWIVFRDPPPAAFRKRNDLTGILSVEPHELIQNSKWCNYSESPAKIDSEGSAHDQ